LSLFGCFSKRKKLGVGHSNWGIFQFGSNYIGKCQDNDMKNGEWWRDNGHNMVVNKDHGNNDVK
jgi:hypothetical protein